MTIKQRLYISFSLIVLIIVFIVGVFFYSTYNLNQIQIRQENRYAQIIRVEKLKDHNNAFAWIVLDIITDQEKKDVVIDRFAKATVLFKELNSKKNITMNSYDSFEEKENLTLIFSNFEKIESLIQNDLKTILNNQKKNFTKFNKEFNQIHQKTIDLLDKEVIYLEDQLEYEEKIKEDFIYKIKVELVILLLISFTLSLIISRKIINEIQGMLKKVNNGVLQLFSNDENTIKVDIGKNNELSQITDNLNSYLEKQRDLIHSREELLRNISHELKTPITKGKFLVEKLKKQNENVDVENINKVFMDIEELTSKLLQREKLNFATLNTSKFKISSLILEALSKLSIEDESKVVLDLIDDFEIQGDKYYLTIALKNLVDNAYKYAVQYPIVIKSNKHTLYIENKASKLTNDLIYYIQPFTREPNQQQGHGLGLNIVNKILQMHNFSLNYHYKNSHNIFYINF